MLQNIYHQGGSPEEMEWKKKKMCQKIAKPVCKFIIYQQYINGRVTLLVIVIIIASFILARQ